MDLFSQTRGGGSTPNITLKESILSPKASFGGLYTLTSLPKIPSLKDLLPLSYDELTLKIFSLLHLQTPELESALQSYKSFDDPSNPAPISEISSNLYLQELYHGPSRAFKDMALQPLGRLFASFAKNDKYLILTATSGDTGPATLESFKNMENIKVVCLYPAKGTSDVQRLQMSTQDAQNLKVIPILGDFDDAQHTLKSLLNDEDFLQTLLQRGIKTSAANSVNFGRIAFQIIYHIWGYLSLVREGKITLSEEVEFAIPSGNFGNALGAFYAKLMGLPISKIIIASNPNNILTDFIQSGIYDISFRHLLPSYSPAMDILKSSNVERVLFALFGAERTRELMESLDRNKRYELSKNELEILQSHFSAGYCSDEECLQTIKTLSNQNKIIDPHTANAYFIAQKLSSKKTLICSTADWCKFAPSIVYAICGEKYSDKEALKWISKRYDLSIPSSIASLFEKKERACEPISPSEVKERVLEWV